MATKPPTSDEWGWSKLDWLQISHTVAQNEQESAESSLQKKG